MLFLGFSVLARSFALKYSVQKILHKLTVGKYCAASANQNPENNVRLGMEPGVNPAYGHKSRDSSGY